MGLADGVTCGVKTEKIQVYFSGFIPKQLHELSGISRDGRKIGKAFEGKSRSV